MIKLSIIIVSWNTKDLLRQCLESVIRSTDYGRRTTAGESTTDYRLPTTVDSRLKAVDGIEVIVVDNASSDGSCEMMEEEFIKKDKIEIKLIINKENLGFAKGNNIGLKEAKGEYIMLLNSDTVIKPLAIEKLVKFLDGNPKIGIVGPKLLNSDGSAQANCGRFPDLKVAAVMLFKEHFGGSDYVRSSPKSSGTVDWLMGAAIMVRREVFEKVGGLDEEIFLYMEEVEWFYRTRLKGFSTYFFNEAEITHLGRGSSKSGKKEPILHIYRGLKHYYKKHKSFPEQLALALMLKTKALMALTLGYVSDNNYLKETYGQAFKIS